MARWFFRPKPQSSAPAPNRGSDDSDRSATTRPAKWSLGILNDKETDEVPGSILLLSKVSNRNEPLGLKNVPARNSSSSLPSPLTSSIRRSSSQTREQKRTPDGKIILNPQPDESHNDPLNWPAIRRDGALLSLGFYCMLGGGMTPILAAGFQNVAQTYDVSVSKVALTTGLYMMGMGVGGVFASPTAILYGKRTVYLAGSVLFVISAVWCALSPNYASLLVARIFQGIAVSPVECLPSATIAEIFFLHERAYRLGIYTLLLLGGKNLIPLVSAAIINSLGWRWVFWIVAIIVAFGGLMLFLLVPETFWNRTPRPRRKSRRSRNPSPGEHARKHSIFGHKTPKSSQPNLNELNEKLTDNHEGRRHDAHVGFVEPEHHHDDGGSEKQGVSGERDVPDIMVSTPPSNGARQPIAQDETHHGGDYFDHNGPNERKHDTSGEEPQTTPKEGDPGHLRPALKTSHSPTPASPGTPTRHVAISPPLSEKPSMSHMDQDIETASQLSGVASMTPSHQYTERHREAPKKTYLETLKIFNGRLSGDSWWRVALRPFILYCYPAVLWSSLVYSLSVGWLIVLSESVSEIYRTKDTYNFTSLQTGLVYLSPFIGGVLGTAVAGKFSDLVVRFMSRRNDGIYEPEFRLVMAIPVAITTAMGLMGFGWSAEERDSFWVPTIFFGIISFGCSLGSTTAITFAVDSYRIYAGEALVTLNFSKNIFHGLIFSLFFTSWLESDGAKNVFLAIGGIQIACLLTTIPMYIYGKRARMWTVRKKLMEKF
ncbi:serine/threonine kinase 16 [Phyllosticta citribraziliensis]|uniref:Serine/threonine kinase 16 n=1 Tax=Phyllosticta citribraziliensis TaxID=989973 RepID=A0ABR1LP83_9PEZI